VMMFCSTDLQTKPFPNCFARSPFALHIVHFASSVCFLCIFHVVMALVPNAGPQTIQKVLSLVFAADRSLVELRQCLCSLERLKGEFQDQQADYVVNYLQASIRSLCLAVNSVC